MNGSSFGLHIGDDPYESDTPNGKLLSGGSDEITAAPSADTSIGTSPFDTSPFGHAALDDQSFYERAFAPLPDVAGHLNQDPDFTLPSTAGPLRFQLFYYSSLAGDSVGYADIWGVGRRASWPLRLCAQASQPSGAPGPITTVILEREDGSAVRYLNQSDGQGFVPVSPRCFDTLVKNGDGTWDETRLSSGTRYHYPAYPATQVGGGIVSLSYFETVFNQRVSLNYDGSGRLSYLEEPAGRRLTYQYDLGHIQAVVDWAGRIHTFTNDGLTLTSLQYPTGKRVTFSYDGFLLTGIEDPESEAVGFEYETPSPWRIRTRTRYTPPPLGLYTAVHSYTYVSSYTLDTNATIYEDPYGQFWTTSYDKDNNVRTVVDPLGAVRTASYDSRGLPLVVENALGRRTTMTYNSQGQMLSRMDPLGQIESWTYDAYANVLTYQDQMGRQTSYDYGLSAAQRRTLSVTNALSKTAVYAYNSWGALLSVRTPLGNVTTYNWSNLGVLGSEANPLGAITTYGYDAAGNTTEVQGPLDRWTTYTYDTMDRLLTMQNGANAHWQTIYDGVGRVQVQIDPLGNRTSFNYSGEGDVGRQLVMTDARNYQFATEHDLKGREVARSNALPQRTTTMWDIADRATMHVDGLGRATETVYDLARQPKAVVDSAGYRTTYGYDAAGRLVTMMNARGYIFTTAYDPVGRLTGSQDALGRRTTMVYDELGRMTQQIDPLGRIQSIVYDDDNRKIAVVDAMGYRTSYGYDRAGRVVTMMNARNFVWTSVYNMAGQLQVTQQPSGAVTSYVYDAASRQIEVQNALGHRYSTVYDLANRVSAVWDPLNHRTTMFYDSVGNQFAVQNARGNRTTTSYDLLSRPNETMDANNSRATITYDAANQTTALINPKNGRTTNLYDQRGLVTITIDPLNARTTLTLDGVGNISTRENPRNQVTTYTADPLNRITEQLYPDGSRFTYTFDEAGQMKTMQDPTGVTSYSYFANGWQQSVWNSNGVILTYTYDGAGNRTRMQDSLNGPSSLHSYTYDGNNRLTQLLNPFGELSLFEYDVLDRISSETYANGVKVSHLYDQAGRKTTLQYKDGGGVVLAQYISTYDQVDNLLTVLELNGDRVTYTYDSAEQIKNERRSGAYAYNVTYGYDAANNRTVKTSGAAKTTGTYNAANQLTLLKPPSGGNITSTYDKDGNLIKTVQGTAVTTYNWDVESRLIEMILTDGSRQTMTYNAMGLKRSEVTPANGQVQLVWDGENVLMELDAGLSLINQYTESPGVWGGLISARTGGGAPLSEYYCFDLQANTRQIVNASGGIQSTLVYTAFGELLTAFPYGTDARTYGGQFGYQAEMNGLAYARARHYDPYTGRWISQDPVGFSAGDANLYGYVENGPSTAIDPTGTIVERPQVEPGRNGTQEPRLSIPTPKLEMRPAPAIMLPRVQPIFVDDPRSFAVKPTWADVARGLKGYRPPLSSAEKLAWIIKKFEKATPVKQHFLGGKAIMVLPGGAIYTESHLDVDDDGSVYNAQDEDGQKITSLRYPDHKGPDRQGTPLDAAKIPFFVLPEGSFAGNHKIKKGDIAAFIYQDRLEFAVLGDFGPSWKLGEGSIALHQSLGHQVIKNGELIDVDIPRGVIAIIFPGSGDGTPQTPSRIRKKGRKLFEALGGWP